MPFNQDGTRWTLGLKSPMERGFKWALTAQMTACFGTTRSLLEPFPIAVADRMSITGNTTDSPTDYHYYFYRWTLSAPCSPTSGVEQNAVQIPLAFPNPAHQQLAIDDVGAGKTLAVMDIAGRVIYSTVTGDGRTIINVADLSEGLYILAVEGEWSQRIAVRH